MSGAVSDSIATIDADLTQLGRRMDNVRELIHRGLIDLTSMEYRQQILLERRHALATLNDAAAATMRPR